MSAAFRYKAFLSYSHKDHKEARWLHAALEKYRLPKHIEVANQATMSKTRLGRIFRDRDELPAAEDLTAEVKKALQSSEFMIVLCSPRAAASRWVNKEVIEFKKLRGDAAVLPIIIDGEPGAADGGDAALECFPPGVRFRLGKDGSLSRKPAEPIAADVRKSGDGKRRALLKLIAGLMGVGLDQLIEREMQRKQRRVIAVTAASLVGMLAMGALTYQAVTARQEAERNRAQAEDLVEFMLTDLRKKLEPVGRLDVLDAVGEKIVAYYGEQALAKMPDASLGRRAKAFHVLGEVQNTRGDMDAAQVMFDRASETTGSMLERDPDNTDRIFEHSQSVFWSGYQDWQRGNYASAERFFGTYKEMALKLVAADPTNMDWQTELAYANGNLGTLLLRQMNDPQKALEAFKAALDGFQKVAAATPGDTNALRNVADQYAWIADAHKQFGPVEMVLENRRDQQKVLQDILALDERHAGALTDKMISLMAEARILGVKGDMEAAHRVLGQAIDLGLELTTSDPTNMRWLAFYGNLLYLRAEWALNAGNVAVAEKHIAEAAGAVAPILASETPSLSRTIDFRYAAGVLWARLTLAGPKEGWDAALGRLDELMVHLQQKRDSVLSTRGGKNAFMGIYRVKAQLLNALGRQGEAKDALRAAFQQFTPNYASMSPELMVLCQQMAQELGDAELASKLRDQLQARGL